MAASPVNEHTAEFEQLAGLSALDILEGEDLARFEEHAAQCDRCQVMVRLDREALALAAPEMDPSPDFKERLMQRAAAELAQRPVDLAARREGRDSPAPAVGPPPQPAPEPPLPQPAPESPLPQPAPEPRTLQPVPARPLPFWRRSPWASALAAVLVIGLVSAGAYRYENQVVASYALTSTGGGGGSAVVNVRRSGAAELEMSGIQNPPSGYLYEAWIIPPGGQPIPAGTTATGDATLPLSGLSSGSTVAITQERSPVPAPTSPPLMATTVQL